MELINWMKGNKNFDNCKYFSSSEYEAIALRVYDIFIMNSLALWLISWLSGNPVCGSMIMHKLEIHFKKESPKCLLIATTFLAFSRQAMQTVRTGSPALLKIPSILRYMVICLWTYILVTSLRPTLLLQFLHAWLLSLRQYCRRRWVQPARICAESLIGNLWPCPKPWTCH